MFKDFTIFLWLLKLGVLVNLYFLASSCALPSDPLNVHIVVPAQILFGVSAYRCLFPVWYKGNTVFHDVPFSSIFVTRMLATFAEVAFIYQFSHVIRLLNVDEVAWVNALSWWMVAQVVISQVFVWGAIATERLALYFYEELGWAIIFAANTTASAYLYATVEKLGAAAVLIDLNLLFGLVYLPWQFNHLRVLRLDANRAAESVDARTTLSWALVASGLSRALRARNRRSDAASWGGVVGLTWMASYWATLIPMWVNHVVLVFTAR